MTSVRIFIVTILWLLSGCSQESPSSGLKYDTYPYSTQRNFYFLLTNMPSSSDPDAFKMVTRSDSILDDYSVTFCFGDAVRCQSPEAMRVQAVAQQVQGGKVYISEKYVHLSANLPVTIQGRTQAGMQLSQTVRIVGFGQGGLNGLQNTTLPPLLGGTTPGTLPTGPSVFPGGTTGNDPAECAAGTFEYQTEAEIARITNEERQRAGLAGQLTYHTRMACVSRLWSKAQGERGSIGHDWFNNGTWSSTYRRLFNEQSPASSENVAMSSCGGDAASTARVFMNMWMNSQGHKDNILRQSSRTLGVGVVRASDGSCYATQNFGQ